MASPANIPMGTSYVAGQIRRASLTSLSLSVVGLIALAVAAWWWGDYFGNYFRGLQKVDDAMLIDLARNPGAGLLMDRVELEPRELIGSGYTKETSRDGRKISEMEYFLYPVGEDRLLLVRAEEAGMGKALPGQLFALTNKLDREVFDQIKAGTADLDVELLPLVLHHNTRLRNLGHAGFFLGSVLLLLCLANGAVAVVALVEPMWHWSLWRLTKFGDVREVTAAIDQDVASGPTQAVGWITFTEHWMLLPTLFGLRAAPLKALVWAYHGSGAEGQNPYIKLHLNTGRKFAIAVGGYDAIDILEQLQRRAPWAYYGHTSRAILLWGRDNATLNAEVEERRKSAMKKPPICRVK